jgi:hypothetical protein
MSRQPGENRFILLDDEPRITTVEIARWWVAALRRDIFGPRERAVLVLSSMGPMHRPGGVVRVSDLYENLVTSPWWTAGDMPALALPADPRPAPDAAKAAHARLCTMLGLSLDASWESVLAVVRRERIAASDAAHEHAECVADMVRRTLIALDEDPRGGETFEDDVIPAAQRVTRQRDEAVHELGSVASRLRRMQRDKEGTETDD